MSYFYRGGHCVLSHHKKMIADALLANGMMNAASIIVFKIVIKVFWSFLLLKVGYPIVVLLHNEGNTNIMKSIIYFKYQDIQRLIFN